MSETRARRRIRQAVESRGFKLVTLDWEPVSAGSEMGGSCGGWYGRVDRPTDDHTWPSNEVMGLNVDSVIAWVDCFFPTPEPCDCTSGVSPFYSHEPVSMHDPDCKWHLDYWMPWWPEVRAQITGGELT